MNFAEIVSAVDRYEYSTKRTKRHANTLFDLLMIQSNKPVERTKKSLTPLRNNFKSEHLFDSNRNAYTMPQILVHAEESQSILKVKKYRIISKKSKKRLSTLKKMLLKVIK